MAQDRVVVFEETGRVGDVRENIGDLPINAIQVSVWRIDMKLLVIEIQSLPEFGDLR